MLKRLFCCLLFALAAVTLGYAQQTPTTQGTEFWLSFMKNGHRGSNTSNDNNRLIISAKENCTVTVSNDYLNYTTSFNVAAGQVTMKNIPDSYAYNSVTEGAAHTAIHVVSTKDISLYIGNEADNSYDASNVLPVSTLGTEYMIQSYNSKYASGSSYPNDLRASFMIIAIENGTVVEITPTAATAGGHPANQPYTIPLSQGQVYHIMTSSSSYNNTAGDFSGSRVVSNKPVAVFNGNCLTAVPGGTDTGYDHVFEQAMPTDYWGKRFVVTSSRFDASSLGDDEIKVTALNDNTVVTRNDGYTMQLNSGESGSFSMNLEENPCYYLESNNPIAVCLYNHSHGSGWGTQYGDPSMVWISPVEQTIEEITFSTFQVQEINAHYVNIVCYTRDANEVTLMGSNSAITPSFTRVPDHPEFSYVRQPISHGIYTLHCPGGFIAHVYGIGQAEGYAYSVGSSAKTLTNQLYVNDELVTEYSACQSEMLDFRLETNYEPDLVVWNFGDGTPSVQGAEVSHSYAVAGDYEVEVVVNHVVNGMPQSDTLGVTIHVSPKIELTQVDSTCHSVYVFQGIEFPVPFFGDTIISTGEGCDKIFHMSIMEGSSQSFVSYDTACMEYEWFDTLRYESGTYLVILNQPGGCDSLFILNLTIGKPPENPVREMSSCEPYDWDGILCETTDVYRHSYETEEHCVYDSILHFTRYYEPSFNQIVGLTQVAVATNFWPGQYLYFLDDSTGVDVNRLNWELLDNPEGPGQWRIKPKGASCKIIANSMGTRTLHVTSGDEHCGKEAFKVINCTGYGVEENEWANLGIYPNPTRDELVVKGPEMLEIVIYNLLGQKMMSVPANGDTETRIEMNTLPQALYLLEVRTQRGNKTQLVSVIK